MALTLSRWIAATVLGCAALTTGAIVRDGRERDKRVVVPPSTESAVLGSARDRYGKAHRRWRALARRDSILAARRTRHGRDGAPVVQVSGGLGGETRAAVERLVLRQWHALRIDSARTPTMIAVVREWEPDSGMAGIVWRGFVAFDYIVPTVSSPECVAVVVVGSQERDDARLASRLARYLSDPDYAPFLLGPCAFFARFGQPGAPVQQWLASRGHDLIYTPAWLPAGRRGDEGSPVEGAHWRRYSMSRLDGYRSSWAANFAGRFEPIAARACLGGDEEACEELIEPRPAVSDSDSRLVTRERWPRAGAFAAETFFSDLVSFVGPDRFAEIWGTSGSISTAILDATGVSLGRWTRRWGLAYYGAAPTIGARVAFGESLAVATIVAVAVGLVCVLTQRREVR